MLEQLPERLGHALRERRAGMDKLLVARTGLAGSAGALQITSPQFTDEGPLPASCTADGEGVSPALAWQGVPVQAGTLVLVVEDADAPTPQPLVHAIVVDLPAGPGSLPEGAIASSGHAGSVHEGRNSYLRARWLPPDPPPGHGPHRYAFQLFALTGSQPFSGTPGRDDVLQAVRTRGLAAAVLVGTYERA